MDEKPNVIGSGSGSGSGSGGGVTLRECRVVIERLDLSILQNHSESDATVKRYTCDKCDYSASCSSRLKSHNLVHNEEKPFICTVCDKDFKRLQTLQIHTDRVHTEERPVTCTICGNAFKCQAALQIHTKHHHLVERSFKCRKCPFSARTKSTLQDHEKTHPYKRTKHRRFGCSDCDHVSLSLADLIIHHRIHTGERPFACILCDKAFKQKSNLTVHVKAVHKKLKPFKCEQCTHSSISKRALLDHIATHSDERPFSCNVCSLAFKRQDALGVHMTVVHLNQKTFKCDLCSFTAARMFYIKRHQAVHAVEKPFKCSFCSYSSVRAGNVKIHELTHRDKMKKCSMCSFSTRHSHVLTTHLRTHTGERPFACEHCSYTGRTRKALRLHSYCHNVQEKRYSCPMCEKTFFQRSNMNTHKRRVHDNNLKSHACSVCEKTFACPSEVRKHEKIHMDRPFKCQLCEKAFVEQSFLTEHIKRSHLGETFACSVCPKQYVRKSDLAIHMNSHRGIKMLECKLCSYSTNHRGNLRYHIAYHHSNPEDRPFKCDVCSKRYILKTEFQNHMNTHSGIKKFKCELCTFSAHYSNILWSHKKRLHSNSSDRPFKCDKCGMTFTSLGFRRHEKKCEFAKDESELKHPPACEAGP